MICKVIEQLSETKELTDGLKSRASSAFACTNTAHAHLVRFLKKEAKERKDRHSLITALHKKEVEQEQENRLLRLAFCM